MSLDMFPDAAIDHIIAEHDEDAAALQRLRLARRNAKRRGNEWERAQRRMMKANRKLFEAIDVVKARGLDQLDPRSLDE